MEVHQEIVCFCRHHRLSFTLDRWRWHEILFYFSKDFPIFLKPSCHIIIRFNMLLCFAVDSYFNSQKSWKSFRIVMELVRSHFSLFTHAIWIPKSIKHRKRSVSNKWYSPIFWLWKIHYQLLIRLDLSFRGKCLTMRLMGSRLWGWEAKRNYWLVQVRTLLGNYSTKMWKRIIKSRYWMDESV